MERNGGFSPKQRRAMLWWRAGSPDRRYEAIVCDGAIRSGKTFAMTLGFFLWAMSEFSGRRFALCGRTVGALRRNVLADTLPVPRALGMDFSWRAADGCWRVRFGGRENDFFLFGGNDERSAALIQGVTLAGVFLDEVVLMPRSFVEQACARCSDAGSRLWFNCNPAGPNHWFYREWVQKAGSRNCLRLHFTMEDNPSLTPAIRERYQRLYSGVFYRRYILGEWVQAEGRVYDFFTADMVAEVPKGEGAEWYISCDYGTVNPTSMGLWGRFGEVWYRVREFYFSSRRENRQLTDEEYADALENLAGGREIRAVIVDPSAASFQETLRRRGLRVRKADNDVLSGIRLTADALKTGKMRICSTCTDCLREMDEYVWDLSGGGKDRVKKENDHAMDDMRYFAATVLGSRERGGFAAHAVSRKRM